jgi:hypothetical protein
MSLENKLIPFHSNENNNSYSSFIKRTGQGNIVQQWLIENSVKIFISTILYYILKQFPTLIFQGQ